MAMLHASKALEIYSQIGDSFGQAWAYTSFGLIHTWFTGQVDEARTNFQTALNYAQGIDYRRIQQQVFDGLGDLEFSVGDYVAAERYFRGSLRVSDETGQIRESLAKLYDIAHCLHLQGKYEKAAELLSVAHKHPRAGERFYIRQRLDTIREAIEELQAQVIEALSDEVYQAAIERGQTHTFEAVVLDLLKEGQFAQITDTQLK